MNAPTNYRYLLTFAQPQPAESAPIRVRQLSGRSSELRRSLGIPSENSLSLSHRNGIQDDERTRTHDDGETARWAGSIGGYRRYRTEARRPSATNDDTKRFSTRHATGWLGPPADRRLTGSWRRSSRKRRSRLERCRQPTIQNAAAPLGASEGTTHDFPALQLLGRPRRNTVGRPAR